MAKSRTERRSKKLEISLTAEEFQKSEQLAARYNLTKSELFRTRTLERDLPPPQITVQSYWQLCQMNESLQQMVYVLEQAQIEPLMVAELLATLKMLLEEVRTVQKDVLGL